MKHLSIDIETFADADIKKSGLYKYTQSAFFEILLFAYSIDFGEVKVISLAEGEKIPPEIIHALCDPNITKHAYNAAFEIACLNTAGMFTDCKQWQCTMVHGLYLGYPAGLAQIGHALGIEEDKKKLSTGSALIRLFCTPTKPKKSNGMRTRTLPHHEAEKWQLFKEYNAQDVIAEMEIYKRLSAFPVPLTEQYAWWIDQHINNTGVLIDTQMVEKAIEIGENVQKELLSEAIEITGLKNPQSVSQLKSWIEKETGETLESIDKEKLSSLQLTTENNEVKRMIDIRLEMGKTSLKKYEAMHKSKGHDNRVRGLFQFYGAHTGRFAGRLVQVQNLPRNYLPTLADARKWVKEGNRNALKLMFGNVPDTLSQLIRTAFIPQDGYIFQIADYSSIEARVIAWLAGEQWVLDVFATHGKIYEATASMMFGVDIDTIVKENRNYKYRAQGKVAQLACGYQGSVGAMKRMDSKGEIPEEKMKDLVDRWRASNPNIVQLWHKYETAALTAVKLGRTVYLDHGVIFAREMSNYLDFLTIQLPSGRKLYYDRPSVTINAFSKESVSYMGIADTQKVKSWGQLDMYGGRWVENVVQAIARDCLMHAMEALIAHNYKIVMHIHDEVVVEEPKNGRPLKTMCEIMSAPIPWAEGLNLRADGFESEYYKKD